MNFYRGEAGGVPAAAEGFDQEDAGDEFLALQDGEFLFVAEEILLGGDDVEIADQAAGVAAGGDVESAARSVDGLLLGLIGLIENGEAGERILDFAEGFEHGAAIAGDGGVVIGLRELNLSAACASGENALRYVGAERPEGALDVGEFGDVGGLPATTTEKIERRIVGSFGDADLRVGDGHLAFGFGDVRTTFEKIGRQTGVERRRFGVKFAGGEMKIGSGLADQDGDGVFKLFALLSEKSELRARGVEQRFFLRDIEAGGDAAFVTRIYEVESFGDGVDGAGEQD